MSKSPRLCVTITTEQHALLLELAELNGGSAASYMRQMLDQATPLLRTAVPLLRAAAENTEQAKAKAGGLIADALEAIREAGADIPPDLLDGLPDGSSDRSAPRATSGSEAARPERRKRA